MKITVWGHLRGREDANMHFDILVPILWKTRIVFFNYGRGIHIHKAVLKQLDYP